jgi:hypothetical protein
MGKNSKRDTHILRGGLAAAATESLSDYEALQQPRHQRGSAELYILRGKDKWRMAIPRWQVPILASGLDLYLGRERFDKFKFAQSLVLALAPEFAATADQSSAKTCILYTAAAFLLANGQVTISSTDQDVAYRYTAYRLLRVLKKRKLLPSYKLPPLNRIISSR